MDCLGTISIPLFLTKNPESFPDSTLKAHFSGFNHRWCNLMSQKASRRWVRWSPWDCDLTNISSIYSFIDFPNKGLNM